MSRKSYFPTVAVASRRIFLSVARRSSAVLVIQVVNDVGELTSAYYLHRHLLVPPLPSQQLNEGDLTNHLVPLCAACHSAVASARLPEFSLLGMILVFPGQLICLHSPWPNKSS